MFKKIFVIIFLIFLSNCTGPGTALLGPTFTGVKTGSVYQSSLSYGSGKIINNFKDSLNTEILNLNKSLIDQKDKYLLVKNEIKNSKILVTLKISNIETSEILEEEPLP
tara:strand:- start:455 stop:781 length:327 start_codon:yes stop_codon:yes gene_type:complete